MLKTPADISSIKEEFDDIIYSLDERRIRIWCASKARAEWSGRGNCDELDKELERRGHRFARYADDCVPRRRTVGRSFLRAAMLHKI
ncbi:MAG TPA: hypothetical protein ENI58_04575 [Nitrospirae bacterium]|nr:hypothetical protein [Nitrospirota bacterium]